MDAVNINLVRQLIIVIIPVLTPLVISLLTKVISSLPPASLPILAPIIGVLLESIAQAFGVSTIGATGGALLGLSGVGVREVVDQVKKRGN